MARREAWAQPIVGNYRFLNGETIRPRQTRSLSQILRDAGVSPATSGGNSGRSSSGIDTWMLQMLLDAQDTRTDAEKKLDEETATAESLGRDIAQVGGSVLSGLADIIDKPRSWAASNLSEVGSNIQQGEWGDALVAAMDPGWADDAEGQQAYRDFKANTGVGEYYRRALENNDLLDSPLGNIWARRAVGLAGDVGLDPLTYATLGTGAVGKAGATKAVQAVGPRIAEWAGREGLEQAARRSPTVLTRLIETGKVAAGAADDDVARAVSKIGADELSSEVGRSLASEAAAAYRRSGNVGLRRWTEDTAVALGRDKQAGRALFRSLPDEVRGGVRIGNPLTGRTWGRLTQGGGLTAERLGAPGRALSSGLESVQRGRSVVGGSRIGKTLTLGRDRTAKQAAKVAAAQGDLAAGALAERTLLELDEGARIGAAFRRATSQAAAEAAAWTGEMAKKYRGSEDLFREASRIAYRTYDSPAQREVLLGEAGVPREMWDDAVSAAKRATTLMNDTYSEGKQQFGDLFTDSGYIEGPRRMVTDEARQYLEERGIKSASQFDNQFAERRGWKVYDENGEFKGWQDIDSINASMRDELGGADFFETDPLEVLGKGLPRIQRRVERAAVTDRLLKSGLVTTGTQAAGALEPDRVLSEARTLADNAAEQAGSLRSRLDEAMPPSNQQPLFPVPDTAEVRAIREQLSEAASREGSLRSMISDIADLQGPEQVAAVDRLFKAVGGMKRADIERLAKELGDEDSRVKELKQELDRFLTPVSSDVTAKVPGQRRLGTSEMAGEQGARLDRTLEDKFADPLVAEVLSKSLAIKDPKTAGKFWATHDVALSVWRRSATLGRGPQFIVRNLSSGIVNSWIAGATARHFTAAGQYVAAVRSAYRQVDQQLRSGASADQLDGLLERALEQAFEGKSFKGVPMIDLHRAMQENETLGGLTASLRDADLADYSAESLFRNRTNFFNTPVDEMESRLARAGATAVNYIGANNRPLRFLARNNERAETFLRAGTFFAGVERYGSDASGYRLADILTKAAQFDYGDLSDFERNVLARVFPFFVWTKNNIPYQVRAVVNQPGKVNMILRSYGDLQEALADPEAEDEFLPGYLRKTMGFTTGIKVGEDGKVALGMNLPLTDLNMLNPKNLLGDVESNTLASTSPFIKAAVEGVTGTNTYTGQAYSDTDVGGLYRALDATPGLGRLIPDTYRDPETGAVRGSGFTQSILRNFLPTAAAAERLIPAGQTEAGESRLPTSWWNATIGGLFPVTPQAVVTPDSLERAKRNRAFEIGRANDKAAAQAGIDIDWVRQMQRDGFTAEEVRALIEAGDGGFGASDQLAVDQAVVSALEGNVTLRELIRLQELQRTAEEGRRKREENARR